MEIRNSDWTETFVVIFYEKIAFLRPKKGINRLTGGPRGSGARPLPRAHLGHRFTLIFLPDFPNIPKISSVRFYPVWTPFDILFLRNSEIGKKQQFWAGPPVNRLVPKII